MEKKKNEEVKQIKINTAKFRSILKKEGNFVGEVDFYNYDIYAGTRYYYIYNNNLFCDYQPTNYFQYDGCPKIYVAAFDVGTTLKEYNEDFWYISVGINEDIYQKIRSYSKF